jgi:Domain of unknown function (DUF4149)
MAMASRFAALLAGLWAGVLLGIAAIAAPSAFATLPAGDAGRVVSRVFMQEAYLSLAVAVLLFVVERQRTRSIVADGVGSVFGTNLVLLLGTLFCTVAGYFALLPMIDAARAGQGSVSFATLHAISAGLFVLKGLLVLALAWRLATPAGPLQAASSAAKTS